MLRNENTIQLKLINKDIDKDLIDKLYFPFEQMILNGTSNEVSYDDYRNYLRGANSMLAEHFQVLTPDIRVFKNADRPSGVYRDDDQTIFVNIYSGYEGDTMLDHIHTLFHEFEHHLQHEAVNRGWENHSFSEVELNLLKENSILRKLPFYDNYISSISGVSLEKEIIHLSQPLEKDANDFAYSVLFELIDRFERIHGNNKLIEKYKEVKAHRYARLGIEENYQENLEKIKKIWKFKDNEHERISKTITKVNEVTDMNQEMLEQFFEYYTWRHLDKDGKVKVLEEFDKRLAKKQHREPLDIVNLTNKGINSEINLSGTSLFVLENYFEVCFEDWANDVIENKRHTEPTLAVELEKLKEIPLFQKEERKRNYGGFLKEKFMYQNISKIRSKVLPNIPENEIVDPIYENVANRMKSDISYKLNGINYERTYEMYHIGRKEKENTSVATIGNINNTSRWK